MFEGQFDCPVCIEGFASHGDRRPKSLSCGHSLCGLCISQMLKMNQRKCPICRINSITGKEPFNMGMHSMLYYLEENKKRHILHIKQVETVNVYSLGIIENGYMVIDNQSYLAKILRERQNEWGLKIDLESGMAGKLQVPEEIANKVMKLYFNNKLKAMVP